MSKICQKCKMTTCRKCKMTTCRKCKIFQIWPCINLPWDHVSCHQKIGPFWRLLETYKIYKFMRGLNPILEKCRWYFLLSECLHPDKWSGTLSCIIISVLPRGSLRVLLSTCQEKRKPMDIYSFCSTTIVLYSTRPFYRLTIRNQLWFPVEANLF